MLNDKPILSSCKISKNESENWVVNQLPKAEINVETISDTINKNEMEMINPNENNRTRIICQIPDFVLSNFTSQIAFNAIETRQTHQLHQPE
jgi:hypothetical protein